ncbi:MAG: hypothetical protein IJL77_06170, partial [Clostridia bacterium]|nr:hypothetical protein [Clostridia bacterium]
LVRGCLGFDIFELLKTTGIKTICLDEAHHLKSEWQKALEKFIEEFKRTVKIIALTATPPYDGTPAEWSRYISLCGEIDEEISVPQLVVQKTLCPHQDFIYFSYPTRDECLVSENYKINGIKTSEQILDGGLFKETAEKSEIVLHPEKHRDIISQNTSECAAVAACIYRSEGYVPRGFLSEVCFDGSEKKYDIIKAEKAFGFIIANPDLFSQSISESLRSALAAAGLIHKNRVCLVTNDKITRQLISSSGKLQSINRIVSAESENLGKELRMLILTDYIKRDMIKLVGTNEELNSMGTVPVFESVRRSCGDNVSIAMLSGGMVIIPDSGINEISEIADSMGVEKTLKKIENTGHSEIIFSGSNKNKVSIMTAAFQKGLINVLIGTKSLLGEGWDSPCINSLILASFVGSFMLSNQMRGRAIRTDYNAPDKVSNIWHLITVEPEIQQGTQKEKELYKKLLPNENGIGGSDFATLKRRFDCFLAPAYNYESVESGIERLDIIKAPFDEKGIADINEKMLSAASERKKTAESWISYLHGSEHTEILDVVEIKNPSAPKNMAAPKLFGAIIDAAAMLALILLRIISDAHGIFGFLFTASVIIVSTVLLARFFKNIKIWK